VFLFACATSKKVQGVWKLELQGGKRKVTRGGSDRNINMEHDNEQRNDSEDREMGWNLGYHFDGHMNLERE
jgi:hypothetical protein